MSSDGEQRQPPTTNRPAVDDPKPPALKPEKPVNLQRDAQVLIIMIGAFLLMIVAGAVYASRDDELVMHNNEPRGTQVFAYEAGVHTNEPVTYAEVPPVGGPHASVWQNCGFYDGFVPSERAVHSMEHGAVWITYDPDLPREEIDKLREIAEDNSYVLVSMFDGLPNPIVASAWNHQLDFKVAGDPLLTQFVSYLQQGPETPELGAPCTGGSSELAT